MQEKKGKEERKGKKREKKKKERKEMSAACVVSVADLLCVSILDQILLHVVRVRVSAVPWLVHRLYCRLI